MIDAKEFKIRAIDSEFVEEFCNHFKGRYLTLNTFRKLSKDNRRFHLFGHWNIIHEHDNKILHSYLDGGDGSIKETFSETPIGDINKVVFIKHKETFILFKRSKGILKPEFVYNEIRHLQDIDHKRIWLHEHGVQVKRKINFLDGWVLRFKTIDAFTGQELEIKQP